MNNHDRLEELLARWDDLREQGQEVSAEELCDGAPELARELKDHIQKLKAMDWLDGSARAASTPPGASSSGNGRCCGGLPGVASLVGGRYRLDALIAEGGFGQVWRATDTLLLRPVAAKVMALNCVAEARRVAQLKHPGIVSVHDVGDGENFCFIVFDLVEGSNLAERLRQGRPSRQEAVALVAAVAENLHYAHEKGFVHRDIKPANILLDRSGRPVLADFGIALTAGELQHESVRTTGTLAYMSPEQLTPGASVDARTDIYSLGVVLYELLMGRPPFHGETVVALREQILNGVPPPFRSAGNDAPAQLEDICRKCLSKRATERYATAQDLADDLRRVLGAVSEVKYAEE